MYYALNKINITFIKCSIMLCYSNKDLEKY